MKSLIRYGKDLRNRFFSFTQNQGARCPVDIGFAPTEVERRGGTKEKLETMNIVNTQMYIDGYQVKLVSDTSYGSLWEVSFTLKEF